MRIVQIQLATSGRKIAIVADPYLHVLANYRSLFELACEADRRDISIVELAEGAPIESKLDYEPIYSGQGPWRLLPAFDHPAEPARCIVSGTGLTHKRSANTRDSMHSSKGNDTGPAIETDSMKMFRW